MNCFEQAEDRGLSTGLKIPSGKGQRCIIVGIGSKDGTLKIDCWKRSKKNQKSISEDYHEVCN